MTEASDTIRLGREHRGCGRFGLWPSQSWLDHDAGMCAWRAVTVDLSTAEDVASVQGSVAVVFGFDTTREDEAVSFAVELQFSRVENSTVWKVSREVSSDDC